MPFQLRYRHTYVQILLCDCAILLLQRMAILRILLFSFSATSALLWCYCDLFQRNVFFKIYWFSNENAANSAFLSQTILFLFMLKMDHSFNEHTVYWSLKSKYNSLFVHLFYFKISFFNICMWKRKKKFFVKTCFS